ncbi:hypothetical protein BH11CYA1_BH11CYA1_24040 [soil metagenome]
MLAIIWYGSKSIEYTFSLVWFGLVLSTDHIRPISESSLANEGELVAVRTRTKQLADLCALGRPDQTRLLTAVSEIARNALAHGDGARVCFDIVDKIDRHFLRVTIESNGISSAFTKPKEDFTEIQFSLESVQRLVDELTVEKTTKGRSVSVSKQLPGLIEENKITSWKEMLSIEPPNAVIEDLQQQNRDLVMALNEIQLVKIELEERTRQLQQASMLKAQFVANVSHEIRTPMNAILGITNLLAKRIKEPEDLKLVGHLHEASSSLLTIINSILDLSKIDEGKLEILNEIFSLPDLISGTVAIFVADAEESGIGIEINYGQGFPESVIGDKNRLRQILINLIGNALKFSDKGNVVVNAALNWTNEDLVGIRISVVDEGIGIAEKDLESLFEPFFQLPAAGQRRTGGTGLGLSICKRLVELLDGEIGVSSVLGSGSTFWFELSCRVAGDAAIIPLAKSIALHFEDHKVLLAEDHPVNQLVAASVLEELGIKFDIASNGLEALEAYKQNRYDLILMDCQMPEMNGFETTAAIRALEKDSDIHVPIVAVTANAMARA